MIELIERTLVNGGNLETAKLTLLNQANEERLNRNAEIEHDYRIALLIRECLLTEPKGSSGYGCAKGVLNRLKEKYRDKASEKLLRSLKREEKRDLEVKKDNDSDERQQAAVTGTEEAVVS